MTEARPDQPSAPGARAALVPVMDLSGWIRDLRVLTAQEQALSLASRRRIEGALLEAEELLIDIRDALLLLAYGDAADPCACRDVAIGRAAEMLAGWRRMLETAQERGSETERNLVHRLAPLLTDSLEALREDLRSDRARSPVEEKRLEEIRQLLERPNLPVM